MLKMTLLFGDNPAKWENWAHKGEFLLLYGKAQLLWGLFHHNIYALLHQHQPIQVTLSSYQFSTTLYLLTDRRNAYIGNFISRAGTNYK